MSRVAAAPFRVDTTSRRPPATNLRSVMYRSSLPISPHRFCNRQPERACCWLLTTVATVPQRVPRTRRHVTVLETNRRGIYWREWSCRRAGTTVASVLEKTICCDWGVYLVLAEWWIDPTSGLLVPVCSAPREVSARVVPVSTWGSRRSPLTETIPHCRQPSETGPRYAPSCHAVTLSGAG